jgi:putative permease
VGAFGVAVPVFVIGYLEWGMTWDLGWVMIAYAAIQIIDGYVLVPWLFSEAVQLHPVLILLAVVLFGSAWGIWGMFFAIPLATFVKTLFLTFLEFRDSDPDADLAD